MPHSITADAGPEPNLIGSISMAGEPILTESQERAYLQEVRRRIRAELDRVGDMVDAQKRDMREFKKYMSESKADMDHVEKVAVRQTADQMGMVGDHTALGLRRLERLFKSCYFGRIDFRAIGSGRERPVYIGMHSFYEPECNEHLVHDWRAHCQHVLRLRDG